ncbi:hypothetical protein DFQ27_002659 [Actinomortierella ambigua]|uniref:Uncharacterized protein n=1 Tax=Actinomortierella ambigua TaxID=1343610 RepID=A0A9P6QN97_9FUNG|nr:hypothetical protein DFQ27_002659 [Actinomortierella ambigua]
MLLLPATDAIKTGASSSPVVAPPAAPPAPAAPAASLARALSQQEPKSFQSQSSIQQQQPTRERQSKKQKKTHQPVEVQIQVKVKVEVPIPVSLEDPSPPSPSIHPIKKPVDQSFAYQQQHQASWPPSTVALPDTLAFAQSLSFSLHVSSIQIEIEIQIPLSKKIAATDETMAMVVAAAAAATDAKDEKDLALVRGPDQGLHPTLCPIPTREARTRMTAVVVATITAVVVAIAAVAEAEERANATVQTERRTRRNARNSSMWNKESEFQAWLMEVKHLNPETIPQTKMKEHFVGFMEDYNTVTMPHEKFYDLEKWETRQRAIRMGEAVPDPQQAGKVNLWDDQEKLRQQQRDKRRLNASNTPMYVTTSMLEEMRRSQHELVGADRLRRMGFDTSRKGGRH